MKIDLSALTIKKTHEHLMRGDFSAVDLSKAYLAEIKKRNKNINAYLEVFDDVLDQAKAADVRIKEKKASVLTGIPLAIKDNILIEGRTATAASKVLEGYTATYDATAIAKLKKEGVVFLGRTNMDEFAMGSSTENSAYGVTKNPHDETRVPGGSSGGSAAAVAMGGALAALGSDTGGSVRQPGSFCGVVGMKPSYGRVSRHGLMAMGSSLDQIGPITRSVEDAEILFNAIAGRDPLDSTSRDFPNHNASEKKLRVGTMMKAFDSEAAKGIDPDVLEVINNCREKCFDLFEGDKNSNFDATGVADALAAYYIIIPAEVSSNLARFDGVKYGLHKDGANLLGDYLETRGEGFGKEVRRRILLGTYVLSSGYYDAYYAKALAMRDHISETLQNAFKQFDILITPTAPTPAFKIGEKTADPLSMYLADVFTVTANIAGIPAISIPAGTVLRDGKKLPVGIQLMANYGREDILFEAGKLLEKAIQ